VRNEINQFRKDIGFGSLINSSVTQKFADEWAKKIALNGKLTIDPNFARGCQRLHLKAEQAVVTSSTKNPQVQKNPKVKTILENRKFAYVGIGVYGQSQSQNLRDRFLTYIVMNFCSSLPAV